MPPKAAKAAPSKKADQKKKEKIIEDKTFGLKNKKGAKNQKFIQQIEKQVKSGGVPARKAGQEPDKNKKKEDKLKELKELNQLFKPVQKVDKNADPKTIVCAFFKHGQCAKGNKCKFSHDLAMERKAEKRSLYVDGRDNDDKGEDSMDNWDEAKLKEVVEKKHGESKTPTTTIICKFFLEAVEKSKYGWFWTCPNGPSCIYRHALPPGFVLKKDKKKDEKKEEISLEDLIEREREALASKNFTKVTLETFLAWKKRKLKEKKDSALKSEEKKRLDFKAGRQAGLSGRDMFLFNPELIRGDDCEDGDVAYDTYQRNEDDDDSSVKYHEIDLENVELEEVDDSGTQASIDRLKREEEESPKSDDDGAAAAVPIDEDLFLEDDENDVDDDDLDNIDEELKDLGIE
ncbi:unnamed protein product [Bemisia tabaci]|uniref:C3H1-type domain-containing protein n=1 Tax=Bemisia tabaci TaxID=7038 RepID=A0A9P0EYY7_BEMTA|nr:PREDICTED: zinc finger CCCH domain-containing protein 15 homolog [Bemisia tabaci]CAH0385006.1 unnamed protein product [Bemisia tabaci]